MRYAAFLFILAAALAALCALAHADYRFLAEYNGSNSTASSLRNLTNPVGIAVIGGVIYSSEDATPVIYVIDENNTIIDRIGAAGVLKGQFDRPRKLSLDNGTIYISDPNANTVFRYDPALKTISSFLPRNWEAKRPMAVARDGDKYYVIDGDVDQVAEYGYYDMQLKKTRFMAGGFSDQMSGATDIEIGGGKIFICDKGNNRIKVYDLNWTYLGAWGTGRGGVTLNYPEGIAYGNGKLYVADTLNNRVVVYGNDGFPIDIIGGEKGRGEKSFNKTTDVAYAAGVLYVADFYNARIVAFAENESSASSLISARLQIAKERLEYIGYMNGLIAKSGGQERENNLGDKIASVQEKLSGEQYGAASELLQTLDLAITNENVSVSQALRLALQATLDTYKERSSALEKAKAATGEANSAKNKIIDAQAKIDSKEWEAAVELVQWLGPALDRIESGATGQETQMKNATAIAGQSEAAYFANLSKSLKSRLAILEDAQAKRNFSRDFSALEASLDAGTALAMGGNFKNANSTLMNAEAEIAKAEKEWKAALASSEAASSSYRAAQSAVEEANKWKAFGANSTIAQEQLSQGEKLIYTDPARAKAILDAAARSAQEESSKGSSRALAAAWLASAIIGIMVVGAAVIWASTKRRK